MICRRALSPWKNAISEKRKAKIARVGKVARARIIQVLMVFTVVGTCRGTEEDAVVPKRIL